MLDNGYIQQNRWLVVEKFGWEYSYFLAFLPIEEISWRIDICTHDTIRISFALTIRYIDVSVNRYRPTVKGVEDEKIPTVKGVEDEKIPD